MKRLLRRQLTLALLSLLCLQAGILSTWLTAASAQAAGINGSDTDITNVFPPAPRGLRQQLNRAARH